MNSKDLIVFGVILVVIGCIVAGVVISNTGNNHETPTVAPVIQPTIIPTVAPVKIPEIYYVPSDDRPNKSAEYMYYPQASPTFIPSPK